MLEASDQNNNSWRYVLRGRWVILAGMPVGPNPAEALSSFKQWCETNAYKSMIFACEAPDLPYLKSWKLTELGRQPLFESGPSFSPQLSGPKQPKIHRELRRQARRALNKGIQVEEIDAAELWQLSEFGELDNLLRDRWEKRGLADFSFLVELNMGRGNALRRRFVARQARTGAILGLCLIVPSERGWLVEHQIVSPDAPNGTGELFLCELLASRLPEGTWVSLGITPLYGALRGLANSPHPRVLDRIPAKFRPTLLNFWERFYGFRSLLNFRTKLEPEIWEAVYWAVPHKSRISDLLPVLRSFAGGSLLKFGYLSLEKRLHRFAFSLRERALVRINSFYLVTLLLWIPILWNLDGELMFGNDLACKVWALYDILLLLCFAFHHRFLKKKQGTVLTGLLLGLVTADTVLAWIQTALYHGGLPIQQPLGAVVMLINTAPVSALIFLTLVWYAHKPVPFQDRELSAP